MDDKLFNESTAEILSRINIHEFYSEYIRDYKPNKENFCPFHVDTNPSFRVFPDGGYKCKSAKCNQQGAGPTAFLRTLNGIGFFDSLWELWNKYVEPLEDQGTLDLIRQNMTDEIYDRLLAERGYTREVLDHLKIGWSRVGGRLAIPITLPNGFIVTVLLYNVFKVEGHRKLEPMNSGQPWGRLWPLDVINDEDVVYLCEGYGDTIAAISNGLAAATVGGSSERPKIKDLRYLMGKDIVIVFDADEAGKSGAKAMADHLLNHQVTHRVRIVNLGKGDLTEYLLPSEGKEKFVALVERTPLYEPDQPVLLGSGIEHEKKAAADDLPFLPLGSLLRDENFGRVCRTEGIVIGCRGDTTVFPAKLRVRCTAPRKKCNGGPCILANKLRHETTFKISRYDPELLRFAEGGDNALQKVVKSLLGIGRGCTLHIEVLAGYTATRLLVTPPIRYEADETTRTLLLTSYYLSDEINTNVPYLFEGYTHRHPKDSGTVALFVKAIPVTQSVDQFEITPAVRDALGAFHAPQEDLWEYFMRYYEHCARSLTQIRGRPLTHMAADLPFFSPVSITFANKFERKAALDVLIFGDPRCGKNCIAEGFMRYYQHGEIVSGENISLMNLNSGIQNIGNYSGPSWGRLAMRHRDTVIIDEMSALSPDDIGKLSRIRGDGIAELDKHGYHVKANAITSIIWLSNPREGRMLAEMHNAIDPMLHLCGLPEDAARWDYVNAVSIEDVDPKLINRLWELDTHKFSAEQYHLLILWVKSRRPEDIVFTPEATNFILEQAEILSAQYHPKGQLIQSSNARVKLAKISCAIAAKVWSTDDTCEKLVVGQAHVEVAVHFLHALYDSPPLRYDTYSKRERAFDTCDHKELDTAISRVAYERVIPRSDVLNLIYTYDQITARHFQELLGLEPSNAHALIMSIHHARALRMKWGKHYVRTRAFKDYLESRLERGFPTHHASGSEGEKEYVPSEF